MLDVYGLAGRSGAIAGFVPSLNKVVVHVGSGWPAQLNIDVVGVPFAVAG